MFFVVPTWCLPARVTDQYAVPTSGPESHQFDTPQSYKHPLDNYDVLQPENDLTLEQEYGIPTSKLKLITKNIYIHIPPIENPEIHPIKDLNVAIPKTHYNIIFIKGTLHTENSKYLIAVKRFIRSVKQSRKH